MDNKNFRKVDHVRGLIIYRTRDDTTEFLLLKKRREEDWSPPKGKQDRGENEIETALRETEEETSLIEPEFQLLNSRYARIYFEYWNSTNVLKKVTLFPAKLVSFSKVIRLSREHEKYRWLPIDEAAKIVKKEYRDALMQANKIIPHNNILK